MTQSMGRVKDFSYFFTLFGFCSVDNLADSLDTSYRLRHALPASTSKFTKVIKDE